MKKVQKIWMWIFGSMFVIPEIIFLTTLSSILSLINNFSGDTIKAPVYFLINSQFFIDHPIFPILATIIEWIGILGLLIISIQLKKKIFIILLIILFVWLSIVLYLGYIISSMSLVF